MLGVAFGFFNLELKKGLEQKLEQGNRSKKAGREPRLETNKKYLLGFKPGVVFLTEKQLFVIFCG